jgi:hypothetical protein
MSCPSALITWGATAQGNDRAKRQQNPQDHADPDGQGPIVNMCHQKWKS